MGVSCLNDAPMFRSDRRRRIRSPNPFPTRNPIPLTASSCLFFILLPIFNSRLEAGENAIAEIKASPDGQSVAVAYESGELGVLNLQSDDPLPVYTRYLDGGFNWASDSNALAFVERLPSQPPQIRLVHPAPNQVPNSSVTDYDWKAQPGWLAPEQLVYRSDRDSDHVNLWVLDLPTGKSRCLLDCGRDVTGIWVSPQMGELLYTVLNEGRLELWWLSSKSKEPRRIRQFPRNEILSERNMAFSPSGKALAYATKKGFEGEISLFDFGTQTRSVSLPLKFGPDGLAWLPQAFLADHSVALSIQSGIVSWNPEKHWGNPLSKPIAWNNLSLRCPARLGEGGFCAALNDNLVVASRNSDDLDEGQIHARRFEDLLGLAIRLDDVGQSSRARDFLDGLWENEQNNHKKRSLVAAARAQLERRRNAKRCDRNLTEALALNGSESDFFSLLERERLLCSFFEFRSSDMTRKILAGITPSLADQPLARWIAALLDSGDKKIVSQWQRIGRDARRRRWQDCAKSVHALISADPRSVLHRHGIAFLLRGEFDASLIPSSSKDHDYPELMRNRDFQESLLMLSGGDLSDDFTRSNLRSLLLNQWAKDGQIDPARNLVLIDLSDPAGSTLDYPDILNRYLDSEEEDRWMEKGVAEILLFPRVAHLLDRQMNDTRSHLIFTLAKAKGGITGENKENLDAALNQLDGDVSLIPPSFWDARSCRLLLLIHLYRAKALEQRNQWDDALQSYRRCEEIIDRFPTDWAIYAFDLASASARVQAGKADEAFLNLYLPILRGLGDPLVNPPHEPDALAVGLANLQMLEPYSRTPTLRPFVDYIEAACLESLHRPYEALAALRKARDQNPPDGLRARILLEEASVRSSLGQHRLASDLLATLGTMQLSPAQQTVVIKARAQAEKELGLIFSQEDRIRYLCSEMKLPKEWAATLIDEDSLLPATGNVSREPPIRSHPR